MPSWVITGLLAGQAVELQSSDVPAGSCRGYTLSLTRVSDDVDVDTSVATVDNV